jgi:hypothetical protein
MGDIPVLSHCFLLRIPWSILATVLEHCREGEIKCWFSIFRTFPSHRIPKATKDVIVHFPSHSSNTFKLYQRIYVKYDSELWEVCYRWSWFETRSRTSLAERLAKLHLEDKYINLRLRTQRDSSWGQYNGTLGECNPLSCCNVYDFCSWVLLVYWVYSRQLRTVLYNVLGKVSTYFLKPLLTGRVN